MIAGILSILLTVVVVSAIHSIFRVHYFGCGAIIIEILVVWFLCSMWLGVVFEKLGLMFLIN